MLYIWDLAGGPGSTAQGVSEGDSVVWGPTTVDSIEDLSYRILYLGYRTQDKT